MKIRAPKAKAAAAIIAPARANADLDNKGRTSKKSSKPLAGERGGDSKKSAEDDHDMLLPLQKSTTVLQSDSIDAGAAEMTGK